jgi:hypothetical protein
MLPILVILHAGFAIALVALIFASLVRNSRPGRRLLLLLAFLALTIQSGCWYIVAGTGSAWGGTPDNYWHILPIIAFIIAVIWATILLTK